MMLMFLWLAASAAPTTPASHVLAPKIEARLGALIGDWTEAGKEATYRDVCTWYDRRSFVVCSLTESQSGMRVQAILGYSKEESRFTYQSYANDGTSHVQYGYSLGDKGLVFTDERKVGGKFVRLTTSIIPLADGRLRIFQDRSVMGGPWESAGEVYYVLRH